jgi:hypothetical protein
MLSPRGSDFGLISRHFVVALCRSREASAGICVNRHNLAAVPGVAPDRNWPGRPIAPRKIPHIDHGEANVVAIAHYVKSRFMPAIAFEKRLAYAKSSRRGWPMHTRRIGAGCWRGHETINARSARGVLHANQG